MVRMDPLRRRRTDFHETVQGLAQRQGLDPGHLVLPPALALRYKDQVNEMLGLSDPIPSHPAHTRLVASLDGSIWYPEQPAPTPSKYAQWKRERDCHRRRGGHWWHPTDAMIGWFCCGCGAERDGMPEDGT
jgi:hypothetical protein